MNCADCQRLSLEATGTDLPEVATAHLLECAACRQAHQRAVALRQLIGLKRYEQPAPAFDVRNLARVQAAIRDLNPAPRSWWASVFDLLAGPSTPVLRYAAAAVVLGLLGINWLSVRSLPPLPTASPEAVRTAQPASLLAGPSAASLPPPGGPMVPASLLASNRQPWELERTGPQYGTGSILTGFDY